MESLQSLQHEQRHLSGEGKHVDAGGMLYLHEADRPRGFDVEIGQRLLTRCRMTSSRPQVVCLPHIRDRSAGNHQRTLQELHRPRAVGIRLPCTEPRHRRVAAKQTSYERTGRRDRALYNADGCTPESTNTLGPIERIIRLLAHRIRLSP